MKIQRIRNFDIWILSKGSQVLYRGNKNPWHSPTILAAALGEARLPA